MSNGSTLRRRKESTAYNNGRLALDSRTRRGSGFLGICLKFWGDNYPLASMSSILENSGTCS